ncbi:MAG: phosphotransferase [Phycicoccus sp.]
MTDLERLLDEVPSLTGQERVVTPLPGGLTNENHRVRTTNGLDVGVRDSSTDSGLLGVDRHAEWCNTLAAARAGVGAPVVDYLPGRGVLVVAFLPGRTCTDDDVAANLPRVASAVRRLHAAPAFVGRFDMLALRREYDRVVRERGLAVPDGYRELEPLLAPVEALLRDAPDPLVPCHNDLLAANLLDDGGDIRIVDYEYSGMNVAPFELGNLAAEAGLAPDALAALCDAYLGHHDDAFVARAELWGAVARYGWVLWGVIQHHTSAIEFDFWEWSLARQRLAEELLRGSRLAAVIERAAAG